MVNCSMNTTERTYGMQPYRESAATIVKPIRTGLALVKEECKCAPPMFFKRVVIKKLFFGLIVYKSAIKAEIPCNSLFRCPECLEVSVFRNAGWRKDSSNNRAWEELTGEVVL